MLGRSEGHFHPQKVFPVEVEVISLPVPLALALKFLEQHVLPVGDFSMDGNKLGAWARSEAEERMAVVGGRRGCGRDGNAAHETQTLPQPHGCRTVCPHTPLPPKPSKIHQQMRV